MGILIVLGGLGGEPDTAQADDVPERKVVLIEEKINWTTERIELEIRKTFPEDADVAVAIAKAESELNPNALNPEKHKGCSGSIGIMQIACLHHENPEELYDVRENLQTARRIYDAEGWEPWGAYTDFRYKNYLE
jgi:hypothetical protein